MVTQTTMTVECDAPDCHTVDKVDLIDGHVRASLRAEGWWYADNGLQLVTCCSDDCRAAWCKSRNSARRGPR
jgi:hypothetical protein